MNKILKRFLLSAGLISSSSFAIFSAACTKTNTETPKDKESDKPKEPVVETLKEFKVTSLEQLREVISKIDLNNKDQFEIKMVNIEEKVEDKYDPLFAKLQDWDRSQIDLIIRNSKIFKELDVIDLFDRFNKFWNEILNNVIAKVKEKIKAENAELEKKLASLTNVPAEGEKPSSNAEKPNKEQIEQQIERNNANLESLEKEIEPKILETQKNVNDDKAKAESSQDLNKLEILDTILGYANNPIFNVVPQLIRIVESEIDFTIFEEVSKLKRETEIFVVLNKESDFVSRAEFATQLDYYDSISGTDSLKELASNMKKLSFDEFVEKFSNQSDENLLKFVLNFMRFFILVNSQNGVVYSDYAHNDIVSDLKFNFPADGTGYSNISNLFTIYTLNESNKLNSVFGDKLVSRDDLNLPVIPNTDNAENSNNTNSNSEVTASTESNSNSESETTGENTTNESNSSSSENENNTPEEKEWTAIVSPIKLSDILNINNLENSVILKVPLFSGQQIYKYWLFVKNVKWLKTDDGQKVKLELELGLAPFLNLEINPKEAAAGLYSGMNAFIKINFNE
ncbi:hypothetical protein C4M96_01565 [Mycoplasmopsis pullorum]|uniref:hypothetical protein n=1 Tax=Mycoplasmopsis pullorum TaxID=48003 RepID=UPI001119E99A|nr:hypothetical protein [Mycoplasmopsis pullorum]TNK92266.1 hypothetical protein C4M96_01565 [Mycoplasmopsis pullorum]